MSATDELRRMLGERGVEWIASGTDTCWKSSGGYPMRAWDTTNGTHMRVADLTPEQAIAATLGGAFTREECEASFVHGYSLGTLPVGSDPQWDENRQTVDEHMAELGWVRAATLGGTCETCPQMDNPDSFIRHLIGRETCHVKKGSGDTAGWWVCERCGTPFDMIGALACMEKRKPTFCPGCGARIVEVKDGSH